MIVQDINNPVALTLIPRIIPTGVVTIETITDNTGQTASSNYAYTTSNGKITFSTYILSGSEGDRFTLKISEGDDIIWRGKMFTTTQVTQKYRINE